MIVPTERLELRPLARSEDSELHGLWTSPGVRRFLFDDEVIPADRTREFLDRSEWLFRNEGYGLWGVRLHGRTDLVGFCGLWHFRDSPDPELVFGVSDPMVGRGFGTETARAIVDGLDTLFFVLAGRAR